MCTTAACTTFKNELIKDKFSFPLLYGTRKIQHGMTVKKQGKLNIKNKMKK